MLNRDFSKSNKEYFKKNKFVLIGVAIFLVIGLVIGLIFGMNGNFEIKGYNEFSVSVSEAKAEDYSKFSKEIGLVVDSFGGDYDTVLVSGVGDSTEWIVRYSKKLSTENQTKINDKIASILEIELDDISAHISVKPIVENTDYIYTAVAILLILTIASIFAYARYNGASAVAIIVSCLLGTAGFMSFSSILRLSIGMSYFAMLTILNLLIIYSSFSLFETIREESWLSNNDYGNAIKSALDKSKFRMCVMSVAIMLIGVLFVIIAPATLKYASLNILFMAVTLLAISYYAVPFVWNVLITSSRRKERKVKASDVKEK